MRARFKAPSQVHQDCFKAIDDTLAFCYKIRQVIEHDAESGSLYQKVKEIVASSGNSPPSTAAQARNLKDAPADLDILSSITAELMKLRSEIAVASDLKQPLMSLHIVDGLIQFKPQLLLLEKKYGVSL